MVEFVLSHILLKSTGIFVPGEDVLSALSIAEELYLDDASAALVHWWAEERYTL